MDELVSRAHEIFASMVHKVVLVDTTDPLDAARIIGANPYPDVKLVFSSDKYLPSHAAMIYPLW